MTDIDAYYQNRKLCKTLKEIRIAKGLSQSELARRSGLNRNTVIDIEDAKLYNKTRVVIQYLYGLGLSLGDILEQHLFDKSEESNE